MRRWLGSSARLSGRVALAAVLLSGCTRPQEPLRVGIDEWPPYQLIKLAETKGFFREEGVDVEVFEFGSLADTRRAYETRRIDGLGTTLIEALLTRDQAGRNTRVVKVLDFSDGADVIVAGQEVRSMKDLRGRRIGVELGTMGVYLLARALELEGMSLDDVTLVSMSQSALADSLAGGAIEAAVTFPPTATSLLADPRFHAVFSSAQVPGEVVDVIAFGGFVLRERPQEVAAFLRGVDRAFAFYRDHPAEAGRLMAEGANTSPEAFAESMRAGVRLVWPEEQREYLSEGGKLQPVVDSIAEALRQLGLLSDYPGLTDHLLVP